MVDRVKQLSCIFMIGIFAHAIMSDYGHLVLRVNDRQAEAFNPPAVINPGEFCSMNKE